jgi:hypothetical protein
VTLVDAVLVFFAALTGSVVGAYGGLTVERLRGRREIDLRRREDIKQGMLAVSEHAAAALRICADLEATDHWPALYDEDWRTLRAKQLPGQAADMLLALARVDVFLPDTSIVEQRVTEYFDILISPNDEHEGIDRGRLARAAAAHAELKSAIREELQRDSAAPGWQVTARRMLSPREWRNGLASFGTRRDGE